MAASAPICIICARGGSKGLINKNILPLLGKPLLAWSVEQARTSKSFEIVAVSSDSKQTLEIARSAGADVLIEEPTDLASDRASVLPAVLHCLRAVETSVGHEFDTLVLLQATSPMRTVDDIKAALSLFRETQADAVIGVQQAKASPYFNLVEMAADGAVRLSKALDKPVLRRQDAPACFQINGSIYVWRRDVFCAAPAVLYPNVRLYIMPAERSIDVDTELDFAFAEMVLARRAAVAGASGA